MMPDWIEVIDSHTEGEPTRVVLTGWPAPPGATMAARLEHMRANQDALRAGVVLEPRGHDAIVGALLTEPVEPGSTAGVIFFNNVGYLGMCGHGLIGVVRTLEHLGRIEAGAAPAGAPGSVRIDTPAGTVDAWLGQDGAVTIRNVPSRLHARDVSVDVPGVGRVTGDVAWGGNWFFITDIDPSALVQSNLAALTRLAARIKAALDAAGVTGADGAEIDHIELGAPSPHDDADARNFVLCPGGAYDRSPCGTGTSAKMAALHARGMLPIGREWRQSSVTGGLFVGWLEQTPDGLVPWLRGRAFITAESRLHFDPADPFRGGLGAAASARAAFSAAATPVDHAFPHRRGHPHVTAVGRPPDRRSAAPS